MAAGDIVTYTKPELDRQIALGQASLIGIKTLTGAYTFAPADAGWQIEYNSTSPGTFTVPSSTNVVFKVGTIISLFLVGTGPLTIAGASGVTLQSASGLRMTSQYATAALIQRATDVWAFSGFTAV